MFSLEQLRRIYVHAPSNVLAWYYPFLTGAMREFSIIGPAREAAFLAQIGLESNELKWMEELASGDAYEGRRDLGNTQPGDGKRYKGRGPIQLTGRKNYELAGAALDVDLVSKPELAADPHVAFRVSCWFWHSHGLNALADAQHFDDITHRVNGGFNGKAQRDHYYEVAKDVLGVGPAIQVEVVADYEDAPAAPATPPVLASPEPEPILSIDEVLAEVAPSTDPAPQELPRNGLVELNEE
jgi:predicted chitinase